MVWSKEDRRLSGRGLAELLREFGPTKQPCTPGVYSIDMGTECELGLLSRTWWIQNENGNVCGRPTSRHRES